MKILLTLSVCFVSLAGISQQKDTIPQKEKDELEQLRAPIMKEMEPLNREYEVANNAYRDAVKQQASEKTLDSLKEITAAIHEKFEPYHEKLRKLEYKYAASHPDSYSSAQELLFLVSSLSLDSSKKLYNSFTTRVKSSSFGKNVGKEIAQLEAGSPGHPASDFTTTDINGKKLQLSSFRGKPVIIDFWASWCVPCRHGNPHMRELYSKYHGKGLEIISVSDDDGAADKWKKAVEKDSIGIWHHVLRGLDWDKIKKDIPNDKDISEKFGIHSLPTKILIDKNGKIIGRYGEGEKADADLDNQLASLFGDK